MSSVDELNMDETEIINEADLYTEFVLTGVKSGKTRIYANRPFIKGICKVLKEDQEKVARILSRYYAAFPIDQCEKIDGVWFKKEKKNQKSKTLTPDSDPFLFMSYEDLKSKATEMGLDYSGNISKQDLIALVKSNTK